jgi:CRP-like cAMP-binding protein
MANLKIVPTAEALKEIKLFQAFTPQELTQIIQLGKPLSFEAYSNIVIEGELSWGLYLILDGVAGVQKASHVSGTTYDIGQLQKGGFFGEMSLVDENPRSATVRALSNCELFFISKESFSKFLNQSQERKVRFYETCVKGLVMRLRELNDNYVISQYQLWKQALNKPEGEAA